jgi:molybdate transport system ATP-binding protein
VVDPATSRGGLTVRLRQDGPIPLDVELAVAPGQVSALVGPSGSGKSTALRAIAGLYRPTQGCIVCNGDTWLDTDRGIEAPARRRRIGFVFQSYALFPHLSALGNVAEALRHHPASAREARARGLLELVRLAGLEARRPAQLSGGQQQRVALARALARDPEVLLLDEPFAAVDRVTRHKLQRELAELRDGLAMPVLLVTHDLDEAVRLADQVSVIHRGRTLQTDTPQEVMTRPTSPLVARLVDLRNLFTATVAEHRTEAGHTILQWHDHRIEARLQPDFAPGAEVAWCIPSEGLVLHRRDRPSRGERENPVFGRVAAAIRMGELTSLSVDVGGRTDEPLYLAVPTHVARRNGIAVGVEVGVSLLAEAIHLMDPDEAKDDIGATG